jgi:hypothetical protein
MRTSAERGRSQLTCVASRNGFGATRNTDAFARTGSGASVAPTRRKIPDTYVPANVPDDVLANIVTTDPEESPLENGVHESPSSVER